MKLLAIAIFFLTVVFWLGTLRSSEVSFSIDQSGSISNVDVYSDDLITCVTYKGMPVKFKQHPLTYNQQ
jgi:hypothetical protein